MKIRDFSLVMFGAITAVSVMLAASVIFYTPRGQAQASSAVPAPGGVSMVVSPVNLAGGTVQGGTIVLQDSVNRVVKVLPYALVTPSVSTGTPVVILGGPGSYGY